MRGPEHFEQRHMPDDDENREHGSHTRSGMQYRHTDIYHIYFTHRIYDISNLRI